MTRTTFFRVSVLVAAALAASGCGIFKKGKGPSTPVLGQRINDQMAQGPLSGDESESASSDWVASASPGGVGVRGTRSKSNSIFTVRDLAARDPRGPWPLFGGREGPSSWTSLQEHQVAMPPRNEGKRARLGPATFIGSSRASPATQELRRLPSGG